MSRPVTMAILALTLLAAGCGESVDTAGLPSTDGFTDWHQVQVEGDAPGHGDSFRIIYVNDVARSYTGAGRYPPGSVIVKEIREAGGGPTGELLYVSIMRKLAEGDAAADGVPLDNDWLFTRADEVGASETHFGYCYDSCHAQAPVDNAWYDYGL